MSIARYTGNKLVKLLLGVIFFLTVWQVSIATGFAAEKTAQNAALAPVHNAVKRHYSRHRYHRLKSSQHLRRDTNPIAAIPSLDKKYRAKINANTVYVISGRLISTYLRMTAEMSAAVDQGDNLRVLPIIGEGALHNIDDILYLKDIDVGILRLDSLEAVRRSGSIPGISENLKYITEFGNDEMHVIVPTVITDVHQLAGKRVNIDIPGSGTNFSATNVFKKLGIDIAPVNLYEKQAFVQMHAGKVDADVSFGAAPLSGIAQFANDDHRFHLISVPYEKSLEEFYLPSQVTAKEYPNLLGKGEKISTIAAGTMLAVFNLAPGSARYDKVARFVDALFTKFPIMQTPPRHPAWKEINLSATIPGWTRFKPAQDWIDNAIAANKAKLSAARGDKTPAQTGAPNDGSPKNLN